jgi:hypothetical protein
MKHLTRLFGSRLGTADFGRDVVVVVVDVVVLDAV